ncbi:glycosyltransferase [Modestobacter versicolor]|uniref:Glycosyltransferase involved in cell wall biosynthesis n=1 Tax=Modestobacter versicolor TaxID=429133 RepID=A0A839Y801_9ACTN|nr:glycosyltransferase [Modestobacter versicolor]MBB3676991.1 glycosyltransferase involved in cell wall biosynthesis [Modestobacter versicolor]
MPASELHVLHLLPHVQEIGNGIVDVTVDLAIAQAAAGCTVTVASAGGEYVDLLTQHSVTCVPLTLRPGSVPAARRLVRQLRPSVVHTHTLKGLAVARLARPGVPVLNSAHRDLGRWSPGLRMADRVIAVSEGIAGILSSSVDPRRIGVVRNGVLGGPRRRPLLDLPPADLAHPAVVYVGGMYEHKGVAVLLRAFARLVSEHPELPATLHLVGDGPDRPALEGLAAELGLAGRAEWAGFRRDAYAYMRSADVFVLPSLSETFGLVLAEAREAGAAIVGAATGGIPEVLEGGAAGVLVPPGDDAELAAALHRVLTTPGEQARLRAAAASGLDWLTVERMSADVLGEYDALLSAGARSGRAAR